jgi:hypothetical protein
MTEAIYFAFDAPSQSSSWSKDTKLKAEKLMDLDSVLEMAVSTDLASSHVHACVHYGHVLA